MTASGDLSLLDLHDLPDLQRELLLWPARRGPAGTSTLAQSAGLDPAQAQQALDALIDRGCIQCLANGQVETIAARTIRTGLWASILRVAGAMDIDHRQSDCAARRSEVIGFFLPEKVHSSQVNS